MSEAGTGQAIVDAFARADAAAVCAALAPDATFHSPVADYQGAGRIDPVLSALTRVLADVAPVSVHHDDGETVAFFRATVEGRHADGVLRVIAERDAPATELTLMVRPLDTLIAGVKAMGRILGTGSAP